MTSLSPISYKESVVDDEAQFNVKAGLAKMLKVRRSDTFFIEDPSHMFIVWNVISFEIILIH